MKYDYIIIEKQDGLAKVILNRPEVMNAWIVPMRDEIGMAFESFTVDEKVRAVLLTGAGRAFCAGHDRRTLLGDISDPGKREEGARSVRRIFNGIVGLEKPVVAMVNGPAMGGGCGMALCCDIVIADEEALFGLPFTRLGSLPEWASTYILPRLVGTAKAAELLFTGRTINGSEAERIGMIYKAVPAAELEKAAVGLAVQLAEGPTKTLGLTKKLMHKAWHMDAMQTLLYEEYFTGLNSQTEDAKEGSKAFLEKRNPLFRGR
ncbi:enoyl-CoA hydratase/isomerase family protein [Chloroflexota bacterium]